MGAESCSTCLLSPVSCALNLRTATSVAICAWQWDTTATAYVHASTSSGPVPRTFAHRRQDASTSSSTGYSVRWGLRC